MRQFQCPISVGGAARSLGPPCRCRRCRCHRGRYCCCAVAEREKRRIRKRAGSYLPQDGQLYKKARGRYAARRVPAVEERSELIKRAHDSLGHFGVQCTAHMLQQRFWWRSLTSEVREFCASCAACQADNPRFPRHDVLHSIKPEAVMHRVGIDLQGPFPPSRSGNTYVVTAVEYATRFGMAAALPDRRKGTVARWLTSFLCVCVCLTGGPHVNVLGLSPLT